MIEGHSVLFHTHALLPTSGCNPMSEAFFPSCLVYEKQVEGALCPALDPSRPTETNTSSQLGFFILERIFWTALCCTASEINCENEEKCELSPLP